MELQLPMVSIIIDGTKESTKIGKILSKVQNVSQHSLFTSWMKVNQFASSEILCKTTCPTQMQLSIGMNLKETKLLAKLMRIGKPDFSLLGCILETLLQTVIWIHKPFHHGRNLFQKDKVLINLEFLFSKQKVYHQQTHLVHLILIVKYGHQIKKEHSLEQLMTLTTQSITKLLKCHLNLLLKIELDQSF